MFTRFYQLENATRHVLLGSGYTRLPERRPNGKLASGRGVWFRLRVEAREGRYRVELTDSATIVRI